MGGAITGSEIQRLNMRVGLAAGERERGKNAAYLTITEQCGHRQTDRQTFCSSSKRFDANSPVASHSASKLSIGPCIFRSSMS